MGEGLRISTLDNKYTIIQDEAGGMRFLRHGEPWPAADKDFAHVGMILAIAQDLETLRQPIPIILSCPQCRFQHVDSGEFKTKPHHTHACQFCGHTWRPAIVNTVGVRFLPGFQNCFPGKHAGPFGFAKKTGWFTCECCGDDVDISALARLAMEVKR